MSEEKKWKKLPAKEKSGKELDKWFCETPELERQLVTLVAMQLRNFALEQIIWARNEDASGYGLFDTCDPYEEADNLIRKLRVFGFLPQPAPTNPTADVKE